MHFFVIFDPKYVRIEKIELSVPSILSSSIDTRGLNTQLYSGSIHATGISEHRTETWRNLFPR